MNFVKSPLRYPGGKSRAVKFLAEFCGKFKEYREPFFGGGSLGIFLAQKNSEARFLANDLNYELFCFWKCLKTHAAELVAEVERVRREFKDGRKLYENILIRRNLNLSEFERAVDFFVLNRITFSGVVDSGGYSQKAFEGRFTASSVERLKDAAKVASKFEFSHGGYEALLFKGGKDVLLFLDPPYISATKSRLYGKNGELHMSFDHVKLRDDLLGVKHKFIMTYDDCEAVRELYKEFYIKEFALQYGMNSFTKKASLGHEVLVSNFAFSSESLFEMCG